mmetsp:Transcript_453/g.766  ORF Transcript_453/g.766 Transcript_453/m.766 type:complete len:208 (+) Transcript_453:175-798(+)
MTGDRRLSYALPGVLQVQVHLHLLQPVDYLLGDGGPPPHVPYHLLLAGAQPLVQALPVRHVIDGHGERAARHPAIERTQHLVVRLPCYLLHMHLRIRLHTLRQPIEHGAPKFEPTSSPKETHSRAGVRQNSALLVHVVVFLGLQQRLHRLVTLGVVLVGLVDFVYIPFHLSHHQLREGAHPTQHLGVLRARGHKLFGIHVRVPHQAV